jgi:hypothetical protein
MTTIKELIQAAHKAQKDAGSFGHFSALVQSSVGCADDPVAAFLGAIIGNNDSIQGMLEDIKFYGSEIGRVTEIAREYEIAD